MVKERRKVIEQQRVFAKALKGRNMRAQGNALGMDGRSRDFFKSPERAK